MKQIHSIVINRKPREAFGFRIIGGKDEGLSFKVQYSLALRMCGRKREDVYVC
jgi:hypothetical protein